MDDRLCCTKNSICRRSKSDSSEAAFKTKRTGRSDECIGKDSNWESSKGTVNGAVAVLLGILWDRLWLAEESQQRIKITNFVQDPLFRAFGRNEHPTCKEYEEFLESRCFPRTRDKMKIMLKTLELPFYDPFLIIRKTQGRMAEDDYLSEADFKRRHKRRKPANHKG